MTNSYSQCAGNTCAVCIATLTVTSFDGGILLNPTSTIPGTIHAGETATGTTPIQVQVDGCGEISIEVELDFDWQQGNGINWIHGVSFQTSPGWSAAQVVLPTPDWLFQNSITGVCSGETFGAGYYYDLLGANCFGGDNSSFDGTDCIGGGGCEQNDPWLVDGDPSDNWGDNCTTNCPEFGFILNFCPQIAQSTVETIGFYITDDAKTGGWQTDDNCIFDLNFEIEFVPQIPEEVYICDGDCVELDAGLGCDTYMWSTGETGNFITVCPLEETDYAITATSSNGCTLIDTITVFPEFCCESESGDINWSPVCPGETLDITVTNYQTLNIYNQYTIVADENGTIIDIVDGDMISIYAEVCTTFQVAAYNHYTMDASPVPIIGDDLSAIDCSLYCCDLEITTVEFVDTEAPTFDSPPADNTIECIDNLEAAVGLPWTDNCNGTGIAPLESEVIQADICNGGTVTRTWYVIDSCMNETTHTEVITVDPLEEPDFINAPADITLQCDFVPGPIADLAWENTLSGSCYRSGTAPGSISGTHDLCGGSYAVYWEFTDECNRIVDNTQNITIDPVVEAVFLSPPSDITVECVDVLATYPNLSYDNSQSGICSIQGSVPPTTTGTYDMCGGTLQNLWQFTDACGRTISHPQIVTVLPAPLPSLIAPPGDITVSCSAIPSSSTDLTFTNGLTGTCELSGVISGQLSALDICTGEIVETWSGNDDCGNPIMHMRTITVQPIAPIVFENPPADITLSCNNVTANIIALNYSNNADGVCLREGSELPVQSGSYDECGGLLILEWTADDNCGGSISVDQSITVLPATIANFSPAPADVTVNCESVPDPIDLAYNNGESGDCSIAGVATASISGNYTTCGGNLVYNWEFTDNCGRTINESQSITVNPATPPQYIDPPDDITVDCSTAGTLTNNLNYSNGNNPPCDIEGVSYAIITGNYDACGGELTYNWSHVDECNQLITETAVITVNPAPDPQFIDIPEDITLFCGEDYSPPNPLNYTNFESDECEISGFENASTDQDGTIYTHTWTYTNACTGTTISAEQTVTLSPELSLTVNPLEVHICEGDSYDLGLIEIIENNGNPIQLEYYVGMGSSPGNQIFDLIVSPLSTEVYTIKVFNDVGCEEEIFFFVHVDEMPFAGEDGLIELCTPIVVNLVEALGGNQQPGGTWIDQDGSGANLDQPNAINFANIIPGTYTFIYQVESGNTCPPDQAIVTVDYFELQDVIIDSVYCEDGNNSYTVILQSFGSTITSSHGDVENQGNGIIHITGIPIDDIVSINYFDPINLCVGFVTINPPDCDCPQVPLPTVENITLCENEFPASLLAFPEDGTTINWYENIDDDEALLINSNELIINSLSTGVYIYYVESESIEFPGCVSATKVPLNVEVVGSPITYIPENTQFCVSSEDLPLGVNLSIFDSDINANPANNIEYYDTEGGAFAQNGEIAILNLTENDSIYARVTNIAGCYSVIGFELTLNNIPDVLINRIDESCAGLEDGFAQFIITPSSDNYILFLNNEISTTSPDSLAPGFYTLEVIDTVTNCSIQDTFSVREGPFISIETLTYECNDNGTGTDSSDDFYTINCTVLAYDGGLFELFEGENLLGTYSYGENISFTLDATGNLTTIRAVDISFMCEDEQNIGPLTPCSTNCSLTIESFQQQCDDNETPSDNSDDSYTLEFNISAINGSSSGQYNVFINNIPQYTFNYDELATINLVADGTTPSILIVDIMDEQCSIQLPILPLINCSMQCDLSLTAIELACFDNETIDNVDDDYFEIEVIIEVINGGPNEQVNVWIDEDNPIQYSWSNINFDIPADGEIHTIYVSVLDSVNCIDSIEIGPLEPCSSDCSIYVEDFAYNCYDNGTPLDSSDDYYEFTWYTFSVEGSPDSMYLLNIDGNFENFYEYSTNYSLQVPADNLPHSWEFIDKTSPFCKRTLNVDSLSTCSDSCALDISILTISCDNNGSNNTMEDDVFFVEILVQGINLTGQWVLSGTGNNYDYDQAIILGPYNILDGSIDLIIEDVDNSSCPTTIKIDPPMPCSSCEQTIDAGADAFIDCSMTTSSLIGISSEPGNYQWMGPSGLLTMDSIAEANQEGWYYFIVDFEDGCHEIDSLFIEALAEIPLANAGEDSLLTCLINTIPIVGQYTSSSNDLSFEWMNEAGEIVSNSEEITITENGLYQFRVIDNETGCISAWDYVFIGLDIEEPVAAIFADPGNILNCVVELINLSHNSEDDVQYEWIYENEVYTNSTFTIDSSGTVILMAFDSITGCTSIDSIFIDEIEEFPIITVNPVEQLDCNTEIVFLDAINTIPSETSVFTWFDENNQIVSQETFLEIENAGTYIIQVEDTISGCINSDTFNITENYTAPIITEANDVQLPCNSAEATLEVQTDLNDVSYHWTTLQGELISNPNLATIDISGAGSYYIQVINNETGCIVLDTVDVLELDSQISIENLTNNDESCISESDGAISWENIQGATEPYEVFVNNDLIETSEIVDLSPGEYNLSVIDANGCVYDTLILVDAGTQVSLDNIPVVTLDAGEEGELVINSNLNPNEIDTIIWSPTDFLECTNCLINSSSSESDITYMVTVYDVNGCSASTEISIEVRQSTNVYVPNIFSPDDDGVNDVFTIYSPDIVQVNVLQIYNRWGEMVFEGNDFPANDPNFGWDGTFKGSRVNPAVFAYYAIVTLQDGTTQKLIGDVTVYL